MTKPYSLGDLSAQLTQDKIWRIKEISDLKAAVLKADSLSERVLLRALVAICYAHWEGYVRFASKKYLEFISLRKFPYSNLSRQFYRNYFLPRLAALSSSNTSMQQRCDLIDELLDSQDVRYSKVNEDLVQTQSNLSFGVLQDICLVVGVSSHDFESHNDFIDIFLLKRRNAIAHGELTLIQRSDLDKLVNTTIELIRIYGNALENNATLEKFKAA